MPTTSSLCRSAWARIAREGTDVTVVAYLMTLHDALAAAEPWRREGISVEVVDPRTLVPFDRDGAGIAREDRSAR